MNLNELVAQAEIVHAHVVDDAYDKALGAELRRESIETFIGKLETELYEKLLVIINLPDGGDEDIIASLMTFEGANILFENRANFGEPAGLLFEDFTAVLASEKGRIDLLTKFLEDNGIKCQTFGREYDPDEHPEPQILFVDLKLNEREVRLEQPIQAVKTLKERYPEANPLVFLMSSLKGPLSDYSEKFRIACELLTTQFEVLHKSKFDDYDDLSLFLMHHVTVYPLLCQLQSHVLAWGNALDVAKEKLKRTLRSLDLPDYFVLYNNTVALEKVPLGTYVSDLLLEYVAHEIEASPGVSAFAKDLDSLKLDQISRVRFNVAPVVGEVFSANVLHAFPRIAAESERGRGASDGYLNLGDIFFINKELKTAAVNTAYVVLSPSCDLVRPDVLKERNASIFLCQGDVKILKPSAVLKEVDGLHSVILRYPYEGGPQFVISWQKKQLLVWRSEDIEGLKCGDKSEYRHVGRLRPLYALQLQHLVTADLSRVGVQRPPDVYFPHGIEVLIANNGKWKLLLDTFREDPSAGAVSHNKGAHKITFMLSDVLVRETLGELRRRFKSLPENSELDRLKQAIAHAGVDRSLMAHVHVFEQKEVAVAGTKDVILPLKGRLPEGTSLDIVESVVFALQERTFDNQYGGGKAVKEGNQANLVFRFVKIKG